MFSFLARGFANLSLLLKQPLSAYCEIETAHGDALVHKAGHYVSWLRVDGMQRLAERKDFDQITEAMRLDLLVRSRRAVTPLWAGLSPTPMRPWSKSSGST